ncbi:MAG: MBL fold metallo-hydrolase [Eubacteriales bacterium]|nr:MBL fold metallo-hydrolase [Eubacteriales bacterium]
MKITWLGTASIRIEAEGEKILFDPFVQLVGGENPNCIEDFLQDDTICITHGHLDHLMEAPEFLEEEGAGEATVFCGSVAADTLSKLVMDTSNVVRVEPGTCFKIGKIAVKVWEGKHAKPGTGEKIKKLFSPRLFRHFKNALALGYLNLKFPEKGQTYLYELQAEGKTVLVMGSLGLKEEISYPTGADLLILPFQGSEYLEQEALEVVERLRPKRILLDHFDDAFPPVSSSVDTRGFKKLMDEQFPQIPVVKPVAKKAVEI